MEDESKPPAKRQRTLLGAAPDAAPPPPPPEEDEFAGEETSGYPQPPGSPPPPPPPEPTLDQVQNNDIVPPPPPTNPPPPPPDQGEQDEIDELDVQDAEYWTRLAQSSSSSSSPPSVSKPSTSALVRSSIPSESAPKRGKSALYLDTINRAVLDFDFEKLCSISLSNINVYACLVCGRYFQGRGRNSYAYLHSIDESHHVFMNLTTAQTYILPDNYAVPEENQAALQDIKYLLNPTFTRPTIEGLDGTKAYDLNGERYWPGFVGLNNVGKNDYVNAVVQALVHVRVVRDYFLEARELEGGAEGKSELVKRFGALVRKMWNPRAFKPQVSPHEFLQQVAQVSGNRFRITHQSDPVEFLGWLLNRLHADLVPNSAAKNGKRKRSGGGGESIISRCFQGVVQVESQALARAEEADVASPAGVVSEAEAIMKNGRYTADERGQVDEEGRIRFDTTTTIEKRDTPFFLLAMDLPTPPPVVGEADDETNSRLIPQVTIGQVLSKYDGGSLHESSGKLSRYRLRRLPPYLIIHFRRFTKNSLGQEERNPTLVNFPIKGLDVTKHAPLLHADKSLAEVYDLVANVVYDAVPGTVRQGASWKCQVHTNSKQGNMDGEKWFAIQDLLVEEVNRQMIFLGESYLQVWEKRFSE